MFESSGRPLIIQGDQSIMLDLHDAQADSARKAIAPFAELEKSPEHFHSYRLTPLSLWNAAAAGMGADEIVATLDKYSRYPLPSNVEHMAREYLSRFGMIQLIPGGDVSQGNESLYFLRVLSPTLFAILDNQRNFKKLVIPAQSLSESNQGFFIHPMQRGTVKQELIRLGYPVEDLIPLRSGEPHAMERREITTRGAQFEIRDYQMQAVDSFLGNLQGGTGYGTVVLPCGGGKTIVGIDAMTRLGTQTLILAPNVSAVHQWKRELLDKTDLKEEDVGEYSGQRKEIRPVTIATYQILVYRSEADGSYPHFNIVTREAWGLIIYDEVHLLPAPIFRVTAEIQSVRRLGLTATLVREDGKEREVFSLVGPKRFDVPWKDLESRGWISEALCKEIRVDLPADQQVPYATADKRQKYRVAAENPRKMEIMDYLIHHHGDDQILVIGQYLDQLNEAQKRLNAPIITGKTANSERDRLYQQFRDREIRVLIVSKVANFAIDLPDASVAIQLSGTFGSRQEEAQRLGRILRPKDRPAYFYTLVSRFTLEEEFGMNRQKFLAEQGYEYTLDVWDG